MEVSMGTVTDERGEVRPWYVVWIGRCEAASFLLPTGASSGESSGESKSGDSKSGESKSSESKSAETKPAAAKSESKSESKPAAKPAGTGTAGD